MQLNKNFAGYFPCTYRQSYQTFVGRVKALGGEIIELPLAGTLDQAGQQLSIVIGRLGSRQASKAILHIAGVHGIEGYTGAAIQHALLQSLSLNASNVAIYLVHCLNPWGMTFCRRVNQNNVDLNRNFLAPDQFSGVPEGYQLLDGFLNPKRKAKRGEWFYSKCLLAAWQHGFTKLKQSIAEGQYEFPQGIFYGGSSAQDETSAFSAWFKAVATEFEKVLTIEVHTGLGPAAYDSLFVAQLNNDLRISLERCLGRELCSDAADSSVAYRSRGDLMNSLPRTSAPGRVAWILQEFGTVHIFRVLRALVLENQLYFHGHAGVKEWLVREFMQVYNPANPAWRSEVVGRGLELCHKGMAWLTE